MLSTPSKMNMFLQRMLKKSDDEGDEESVMETNQEQVEFSPCNKSKWMKKFIASPIKTKSCSAMPLTQSNDQHNNSMVIHRSATFPTQQDAQDLDKIIHEFETNFLSPTKQEFRQDDEKPGKFVKKMVAAFEQKYMNFKDSKNDSEEKRLKRRSLPAVSEQHQESRHKFLNETYVIKPEKENKPDKLMDTLNVSYSKLDDTIDISTCSFAMDEESSSTPVKHQKSMNENLSSSQLDSTQSSCERTPKIVGAFLKKPVEVEDTSIDWIPITGKKLPRKHSFKKLLSILTGRRTTAKANKLFCSQSQNNLHEEPVKEHHDSGYDEKSSSTASLTSVLSFSDVLLHHENYLIDSDQRTTTVSTFQTPKEMEDNLELYNDDFYSDSASVNSKKMIFEEIPRSDVRLSLGPSFPLKTQLINQLDLSCSSSDSCDDYDFERTITPPLPKHPFVSSKDDMDEKSDTSNEFNGVQFRKKHHWESSQMEEFYDTPRSHLFKSEPELFNSSLYRKNNSLDDPVYDIPKVKIPPRPKSCLYEDALSLKRRNASAGFNSGNNNFGSEFYAFNSEDEPHYATVKPRNIRILPSKDLLRSMGNFYQNCRAPVNHYLPNNQIIF